MKSKRGECRYDRQGERRVEANRESERDSNLLVLIKPYIPHFLPFLLDTFGYLIDYLLGLFEEMSAKT